MYIICIKISEDKTRTLPLWRHSTGNPPHNIVALDPLMPIPIPLKCSTGAPIPMPSAKCLRKQHLMPILILILILIYIV